MMNEDLKVRSFRLSEEVAEKLRRISEEFDNQNAALESLISAYEIQSAKAVLTDRQTDISDYDAHLQAIQSAFLHSLEINENAEKRIRAEFQSLLSSKDDMIMMLQEQLEAAKAESLKSAQTLQELTDKAKQDAQTADDRIEEYIKQAENAEAAKNAAERNAEGAEAARRELHDILHDTKQQLTESRTEALEAKSREKDYLDKIKSLEQQLTIQMQRAVTAENNLEKEKASAALASERADLALEKAVVTEKSLYTEKLQSLYAEIAELNIQLTSNGRKKAANSKKSDASE